MSDEIGAKRVPAHGDDDVREGVMPGAGDEGLTVIEQRIPPPSKINDAIVIGFSLFAGAAGVAFAVGLAVGAPLEFYGTALGLGLLTLAYAVRRFFTDRFPDVEAVEPREEAAAPGEVTRGTEPVAAIGPVGRRPLLVRLLVAAAGVFGLSLAVPVASLGPAPQGQLFNTAWRPGRRVVTSDGEAVRPDDIAVGGVVFGWPFGAIGEERSSIAVLRLAERPRPPTVLEWVVDETVVAYSKICTHAGCPVALFRERDNALFCPCHQSTFDARFGAVPTFGPAARALPQLPLAVDDDGFLVALDDFEVPVGPAF